MLMKVIEWLSIPLIYLHILQLGQEYIMKKIKNLKRIRNAISYEQICFL